MMFCFVFLKVSLSQYFFTTQPILVIISSVYHYKNKN